MKLFFDTETTGVPANYRAPMSDTNNWPRLVQIGWIVLEGNTVFESMEYIVKPDGFEIPVGASNVHKITTEIAIASGHPIAEVVNVFKAYIDNADTIVGHNIDFDVNIFGAEYWRLFQSNPFAGKKMVCTMKSSTNFCALSGGYNGNYKWPKLSELYFKLFEKDMGAAHTALQDIENTVSCYRALVERGVIVE